jgi:NitT/TauT family transport system substrate-binding protein
LCIDNVRAYPDLPTSARASHDVGRGSVRDPGLVQSGADRVKKVVALMTVYGKRLSAWAAGIITTAVLVAPGYAQDKKVRFILDWAFQGQQAPFTVPADDGTFKKYKLDVTVDRGFGSGDTVAKVASGAYDIGLADLYSVVRFNGANPDHQLLAVMMVNDKSALAVETKAAGPIKTPQDLNGRSIAAPVGDASRQLFPLFADINKIDQNSIKWINVSPELRETMLLRGEADAITGHLTTVMMNMRAINIPESDILPMPYANYGVELYGHVLLVKPDYAEKNPEVIQNFIRGVMHGMKVMMNDPDTAIGSLKKRDPLINGEVEKARIKMSLDYMFITPNVLQNGMSNVDMARLGRTLQAVTKPFELKATPIAAQIYTDKYLPPRVELKLN